MTCGMFARWFICFYKVQRPLVSLIHNMLLKGIRFRFKSAAAIIMLIQKHDTIICWLNNHAKSHIWQHHKFVILHCSKQFMTWNCVRNWYHCNNISIDARVHTLILQQNIVFWKHTSSSVKTCVMIWISWKFDSWGLIDDKTTVVH